MEAQRLRGRNGWYTEHQCVRVGVAAVGVAGVS